MTGPHAVRPVDKIAARDARVTDVAHLCDEHVRVRFAVDAFPASTAGQFLQLYCNELPEGGAAEHEWVEGAFPPLRHVTTAPQPAFLRRPFSIADRYPAASAGGAVLEVISRAIGPGTRWLDGLTTGATLNLTGPLGRGFAMPGRGKRAVLVGGGVGIPPLLYFARQLWEAGHEDVLVIFGALRAAFFPVERHDTPANDATPRPCLVLPAGARYPACVTTDDGSLGMRGRVTDALARWWEREKPDPAHVSVYACGPDPMLRAVARQTAALGFACELCIERTMGCGLGTCQSCCVQVSDPARQEGWRWALACSDGPVFPRDVLLGYANATR